MITEDLCMFTVLYIESNGYFRGMNIQITEQKNPFEIPLIIKCTKVHLNKEESFLMEQQKSVRIYHFDGCTEMIAGLSDRAQRLLFFIMYHTTYMQDYIKLNRQLYMRTNRIKSRSTVVAAIKELQKNNIICPSVEKGFYWTNPRVFFNGNRTKMYPDNVVVSNART